MQVTIDAAGRMVIPKALRDLVGLRPGKVEVRLDGAALRVEPIAGEHLDQRRGRLVVPAQGSTLDDDDVEALRHGDQR